MRYLIRSRSARWATAILGGLLALVGFGFVALVVAPSWLASGPKCDRTTTTNCLDAKAQADDRRGITTATLALFAGGLGVFSAIITGLTFAHNRQIARETHALDEARLITERFTRAVDQLGSDKLDVRLGGIYALERIARDSKQDHPQVVEVLTAFIREHRRWPPRSPSQPAITRRPPPSRSQGGLIRLSSPSPQLTSRTLPQPMSRPR